MWDVLWRAWIHCSSLGGTAPSRGAALPAGNLCGSFGILGGEQGACPRLSLEKGLSRISVMRDRAGRAEQEVGCPLESLESQHCSFQQCCSSHWRNLCVDLLGSSGEGRKLVPGCYPWREASPGVGSRAGRAELGFHGVEQHPADPRDSMAGSCLRQFQRRLLIGNSRKSVSHCHNYYYSSKIIVGMPFPTGSPQVCWAGRREYSSVAFVSLFLSLLSGNSFCVSFLEFFPKFLFQAPFPALS